MALAKKEQEQPQVYEPHDFVPYACHYNHLSLITKNVELVQIVKLTNSSGFSDDEFRSNLTSILNEVCDPAQIATWIHTVRNKKEVVESGSDDFIRHIDVLWKQALPEELRYNNSVYISFIMDFKTYPLWQPQNFFRALFAKVEERHFNSVLSEHDATLTALTDDVMNRLKRFGAKRLEMVKRGDTYYSEPIEFFHKLMTFESRQGLIPLGDISRNIFPEAFNFNLFNGQVTAAAEGYDNYYSVITLKEAAMLPASALKELLNSDFEIVISEAIDFSFGNKYVNEYAYQKYINSLSEDRKFVSYMGGKDNQPVAANFGLNQINILVRGKSSKELSHTVERLSAKLADLGLIHFAEDIMLERNFWAILPGNFAFLKRQQLVERKDIGSFSCFGVDKYTTVEECMFGEPVTFFENKEGSAHAFHFLNDGQSNVLIAGGSFDERQVVSNLIAAQAARFGSDVIFYDESGRYSDFASSIGALYLDILDLDLIKERLTEKTLIIINSVKKLLDEDNLDFVFNFLDYAASKNATIIFCADYEDNCEALLPNFRTQIFLHGKVEKFADHYDFFEDEIQIVELLEVDNFYFKQGYTEMVLNFKPSERLVLSLIEGTPR